MRITPEQLRDFMNLHGISIKELSILFDITPQAVSMWLSGKREVPVTISKMIRLFIKYPRLIREF